MFAIDLKSEMALVTHIKNSMQSIILCPWCWTCSRRWYSPFYTTPDMIHTISWQIDQKLNTRFTMIQTRQSLPWCDDETLRAALTADFFSSVFVDSTDLGLRRISWRVRFNPDWCFAIPSNLHVIWSHGGNLKHDSMNKPFSKCLSTSPLLVLFATSAWSGRHWCLSWESLCGVHGFLVVICRGVYWMFACMEDLRMQEEDKITRVREC